MLLAGVSTACFYPQTTERALELVGEMGAPVCEIFVNAHQEFSVSFFKGLLDRAQHYNLQISAVHPFTSGFENMYFYSDYPRRLEDGIELYRRYFALTASLGAKFFVMHGSFPGTDLPDQGVYERFSLLQRTARQEGVVLLQENVSRCRSTDPAFIEGMRKALGDEAQFVLDIKQAVRGGVDPFKMLEAMGANLAHLHISDHKGDEHCLPPGKGCFDFGAFLKKAVSYGFHGVSLLELYRRNYKDMEELTKSFENLATIITNITN